MKKLLSALFLLLSVTAAQAYAPLDNSTIKLNGSAQISCATATSSQVGCSKPDGTVLTITGSTETVAPGTNTAFGVAKADNATLNATAGVFSCNAGTAGVLGCVKPDGTIITNSSGAITVAKATNAAFGVAEADNATLNAAAGILSCNAGTASVLGCVKPDGTIITNTSGAITVAKGSASGFGVLEGDGATMTISAGVLSLNAGHANTWSAGQTFNDSDLILAGSSSGNMTLHAPAAASTFGITFPAVTDTLVSKTSTDTLTNKTFDTAGTGNVLKIAGTTISSISGNTSKVATATGTLTSGHCVQFDASGNIVDAGGSCTTGGGGGTNTLSAQYQIPVYTTNPTGTTVGGSTGLVSDATNDLIALGYLSSSQSISATSTDGLLLTNPTAATVGAQKWSPRLHLQGNGWKTSGTAASQVVDWIMENQPVQGSSAPSTNLVFSANIGTGYFPQATLTSQAIFNLASGGLYEINGSQITCSNLSNGATGCSTATGTSGATIPLLNGTNTIGGVWTFPAGDLVLGTAVNGDIGTFNSSHALQDSGTLLSSLAPLASPALTGSPTAPTQSLGDATTKIATDAFVANAINDTVDMKDPAAAATNAALILSPTYANGSSGVGATLTAGTVGVLIVDGYTPALNDRILVKNQASTFQNGCYKVTTLGVAITTDYVLTRCTDYDQTADIIYGTTFPVLNGTVNANQQFTMNNNAAITVGTTAITYAQTSGGSQLTAGTGISITGNSIAVSTVPAANGGTNADSSAATGIAQVAAGVWSWSTALVNGTTATTQTANDNSTKVATTAYVDGLPIGGYNSQTTTYAPVAADKMKNVDFTGSSATTFTLTSAATLGSNWWAVISNSGTSNAILTLASSSGLIDGLPTSGFKMYVGEVRIVYCDGTNFHTKIIHGGSAVFTSSGSWMRPPGYNKFFVEVVAGGGSGAVRLTTGNSGGGGSGGTFSQTISASSFVAAGSTETITVAAVAASVASSNANGNAGNHSAITINGVSWTTSAGTAATSVAISSAASGGYGDIQLTSATGASVGWFSDESSNAPGGSVTTGNVPSGGFGILNAGSGGASSSTAGGVRTGGIPINGIGVGGAGGSTTGTGVGNGAQPGGGGGGNVGGGASGSGGAGEVIITGIE